MGQKNSFADIRTSYPGKICFSSVIVVQVATKVGTFAAQLQAAVFKQNSCLNWIKAITGINNCLLFMRFNYVFAIC